MIIHISQQRYEFIRSQGYALATYEGSATEVEEIKKRLAALLDGDTEFHLLDDEYAFCKTCGASFDSVDANTPVELETIKACPERAVVALRILRQEMALQFKNAMESA